MKFQSVDRTYGGVQYHVVVFLDDPIWNNRKQWNQMDDWCHDQFGPRNSINDWPSISDRWFANGRAFWFKNEADRTMFILRWS